MASEHEVCYLNVWFLYQLIIQFKLQIVHPKTYIHSFMVQLIPHNNPAYKFKVLDYTYTSEPSINSALPMKLSNVKLFFFVIGVLMTAGFLWLLSKWSNKRKAIFLYNVCQLQEATHFLIEEEDVVGGNTIVPKISKFDIRTRVTCTAFNYHQRTYLHNEDKEAFLPIRYEELGIHLDQLKKNVFEPYSRSKREEMCSYYGPNIINLPVKSKFSVFIEEMLTPYEVFQTYTILLWIYEEYYIFSFILLGYALYNYYETSSEVVSNQKKLSQESYFEIMCRILTSGSDNIGAINMNDQKQIEKVSQLNAQRPSFSNSKGSNKKHQMIEEDIQPQIELITVDANKTNNNQPSSEQTQSQRRSTLLDQKIKPIEINSKELLPGDLLILHEGDTVPCDCIILKGELLADENYVTGDSFLIRKSQLEKYTYRKQSENNFTLYMGTKIAKIKNQGGSQQISESFVNVDSLQKSIACNQISLPNEIVCLVINTNYNTLRGKYLRAIRYQKKQLSKFTRETIYFIYILIALTTVIFLSLTPMLAEGQSDWDMFIIYLDLLSTSIPPTLPTLLSVGIAFAQHRLKSYDVSCVLPSNILTGGSIDTIILEGHHALGKEYEVESMTVGIKTGGNFGETYPTVEKFYTHQKDYLEISGSDSSLETINKKKHERERQFNFGQTFIAAIASCHGLQYFENKIQGTPIDKKVFEFTKAKVTDENCYQCQNFRVTVDRKLYFKKQQKKLAVIATISSDKSDFKSKKEEQKLKNNGNEQYSLLDESPVFNKDEQVENKETEKSIPTETIVQKSVDRKVIFLKGDAEKVLTHCKPQTYPNDCFDYIVDMAEKGFHLICYAYKEIKLHQNPKDSSSLQHINKVSQKNLTFLGFLVMKQLRYQDNIEAIKAFKKANIKVLLVSEERELETSSIAVLNQIVDKKQLLLCSITKAKNKIYCKGHVEWQSAGADPLPEFVSECEEFSRNSKLSLTATLYEELFMRRQSEAHNAIFERSAVFNRMEYRHQRNLYSQLDKRDSVSFAVGGGGIVSECASLSMELQRDQSSLLSSFYTKSKSLMTIFHCLRICRAGLATNFHGFSMMILFSLIQFTTVCMLYVNYQSLTDTQTLYEDLFVTFPIFVTLNLTKPSSKLSKQTPLTSFFDLKALASMIGQLILQFLAHLGFILYLLSFQKYSTERDNAYLTYIDEGEFKEKTVTVISTFVLSNYLYLGIVLSTSVSKPFRKPFYTNPWYTLILILLWLYNTLIVLTPEIASSQMRKSGLSDDDEEIIVLAMIYGNLMMVLMYLYENMLAWLWTKYKQYKERKINHIKSNSVQMSEKA